jgi:uncharacterized protein YoxC
MSAQDLALVVIALATVVVAVSFVVIAVSVWGLGRDVGELARRGDALLEVIEHDLPPTIQQFRELGAAASELTTLAQPRLERLDTLLEEAESTLIAVREVSVSLNGLVGGPAATVSSVKRSVKSMGEGVVSGADRLRRAITRDDGDDDQNDEEDEEARDDAQG